jgi:hypothetical protein
MMRGISMLGARLRWMRLGMWRIAAPVWLILLFALTACGTATINYRLTLEVEVDGVLHTGSSVIQTYWEWNSPWTRGLVQGRPYRVNVHGEAVVVDLGERGVLVALLTGPFHGDRWNGWYLADPEDVLGRQILKHNLVEDVAGVIPLEELAALSQRRDIIELSPFDLPMLVLVDKAHNPPTFEQVDPTDIAKNFGKGDFGKGVRLVRATLGITNDPVTVGIEEKLTWLKDLNGNGPDARSLPGPPMLGEIWAAGFKR